MDIRHHYPMLIEWSEEDRAYLVTLPEWSDRVLQPVTHGETYELAATSGQEALAMLIELAQEDGEPLPEPRLHRATIAAD
jgi:antitoxin HicB